MDPFLGEIRIFAGNYAPRGWALCNGQTMPITQNTALFSLLGITYGGDGRSSFGLPDLQGRAPMHWGSGTGLTQRYLGEKSGTPTVTLNTSQLPAHTHSLNGTPPPGRGGSGGANTGSPDNAAFAAPTTTSIYASPAATATMSGSAIGPTGGNQAHNNMQPYQALSFIIALQGIFPQRP